MLLCTLSSVCWQLRICYVCVSLFASVSVSWSCHNKVLHTGLLKQGEFNFHTSASCRSKVQRVRFWGGLSFGLVGGPISPCAHMNSLCVPGEGNSGGGDGVGGTSLMSPYKNTHLTPGSTLTTSSNPSHLAQAPSPCIMVLRIRTSAQIWGNKTPLLSRILIELFLLWMLLLLVES